MRLPSGQAHDPAHALDHEVVAGAPQASAGVPAGPINDVAQVFADPQVVARGLRIMRGGVPRVASPIVIDGCRQVSDLPGPRLGAGRAPKATS